MMLSTFLLSVLAVAAPVFANNNLVDPFPKLINCTIPPNSLVLTANQTQVLGTPPAVPRFLGLSLGTNNFTCNTTDNTWSNTGIYSILLDVSCLVTNPHFSTLQNHTWEDWKSSPASLTVDSYFQLLKDRSPNTARFPIALGLHPFIKFPSYGPSNYPFFDFTEYTGNKSDTVTLKKVASWDDGNPDDVPWLQVNAINGTMISKIWRVDTQGGGAPNTSCKAGDQDIAVRYSGTYWMYQ